MRNYYIKNNIFFKLFIFVIIMFSASQASVQAQVCGPGNVYRTMGVGGEVYVATYNTVGVEIAPRVQLTNISSGGAQGAAYNKNTGLLYVTKDPDASTTDPDRNKICVYNPANGFSYMGVITVVNLPTGPVGSGRSGTNHHLFTDGKNSICFYSEQSLRLVSINVSGLSFPNPTTDLPVTATFSPNSVTIIDGEGICQDYAFLNGKAYGIENITNSTNTLGTNNCWLRIVDLINGNAVRRRLNLSAGTFANGGGFGAAFIVNGNDLMVFHNSGRVYTVDNVGGSNNIIFFRNVATSNGSDGFSCEFRIVASVITTPPTCSSPGTSHIADHQATNIYTFSPSGPTVDATGLINGMVIGTSYTVTINDGFNTSEPSALFSNTAQLPSPVANAGSPFTKTCVSNSTGAQIGAAAVAGTTYAWSPATGLSNAAVSNPIANPAVTTTYTLTATNTSGCTATGSVTVTVNNTIPSLTASVTVQPTCTTPTGTIVVSAPAPAANVMYMLQNTIPASPVSVQLTNTFVGVSPGNYDVTTTNTTTGCVSAPVNLTVNSVPGSPVAPTASVTIQPTCTTPTGTITVSAPAPAANVTYTVTGTNPVRPAVTQATTTFAGLLPGDYAVTTTNTTNGCTSPPTNVTVNGLPPTPVAPTASVTQPTCTVPTGTITVTAPTPAPNLTYTVTGTSPVRPAVTQSTVTFAGLLPGDYDVITTNTTTGCGSFHLNFTVNTVPGSPVAPTASVTQPTCTVPTGTITVSAPTPAANVTYTVTGTNPVRPAVTQSSQIFAGLLPGIYDVTTTNTTTGCGSPPTNVTVNIVPPNPVPPTASVTQPTCTVPTGTITVSAPTPAANVTYTVTGTNPVRPAVTQSSQIFAGLLPGIYDVTTTNTTTGCISPPTNLTVNSIPANPVAPTASVTQPTCTVPTGTITVSAPTPAANVTYTVTGTNPVRPAVTQSSQIFASLLPGLYDVITTNTTTGCISPPTNVTVNIVPVNPTAPTASMTQPTCTVPTGTITVSAPTPAANVTYTVTGTNPVRPAVTQSSQIFAGLLPGIYDVTTTNTTTGCISPPTNVTVNTVPGSPVAPTASVTQPTCTVPTGTITVSAPTPAANVTYTVTGTNPVRPAVIQSSQIFAGLLPGIYDVSTTNTTTGCGSPPTNVTVNIVPVNPTAPTASVTQPTCTVPTGTITISAPTPAANVTYTVTGTSPVRPAVTQATVTFAGLLPGIYDVTTTNTTTGCISPPTNITVNIVPVNPTAPTASVTQPTCTVPTGTITISAPTPAANVTYTVTGTNPVRPAVTQSSQLFAGLLPGIYDVTTTNTTTGCISPPTNVTVNIVPVNPVAPTASVTQPTCTVPTGTITVSAPTPAANVTYTVTGTNPVRPAVTQSSQIFAGLLPGNYDVTTTNTTTGCISLPTSLIVNNPQGPVAPTVSITTQPTCTTPTATITITAPTPAANVTYTVTGTNPIRPAVTQASHIFAGLPLGNYDVTTTDTTTGCVSPPTGLTIGSPPGPPPPVVSVTTQPTCTTPTATITITAPTPAANVTYTVTGTNPVRPAVTQTSQIFAGLSLGNYNVTTTNTTTGCTSLSTPLTIGSPQGPAVPTASVTIQPTCTTPTGTITVSAPAPAANVTYTVTGTNPVRPAVTQASHIFAGLSPGNYEVTTTDTTTGCVSAPPMNLTVNGIPPNPVAPTASVTIQPTCNTPTGTITVSAPTPAANVTYTVTGTSPVRPAVTQATTVFAGLLPGIYDVTTTNTTTGCTSPPTSLTVNSPQSPVAPTVSITTQPTCNTPTATITISAPTPAANVTYTVTGTNPVRPAVTQSTITFAGLPLGNYDITTTDTTTGCTSPPTPLTIGSPQSPVAPTASVTIQPTCITPTGAITVSSPTPAANVTYTVTGTNPVRPPVTQASHIFAGLPLGNYDVTTTNTTTGCTSPPTPLIIGSPQGPAAPTASVTIQPTCTTPTGTITVSVPTPAANVTYTVIGTNPVRPAVTQASHIFAGLSPGNYDVTTTDTITGCVSPPINLTVNGIPPNPIAPTASVTIQPTCTTPTGTITVSAPTPAANVTYTVTGTSPVRPAVTQSTTTFAGLLPGIYDVTTTNTTTGCISLPTSLTVSNSPGPLPPTVSVTTQPTCNTPTATVTITSPTPAANVTYTVIGTNPVRPAVTQSTNVFTGVPIGNYDVSTTNITTGCVSPPTGLTIGSPPGPPPPVASVTTQPTCNVPTGTITITAPIPAANVTYTVTGTNPVTPAVTQSTTIFAGLPLGNYNVTTTDTTTGCTSLPTSLTIGSPQSPVAPTAIITIQPTCNTPTGEITVSSPTPAANVTYTVTGTNPVRPAVTQSTITFSGLALGNYNVTTTNTTTGCTSPPTSLTVNSPPGPAAPTASVTIQPTCTTPTGTITVSAPTPAANVTYTVIGTNPVRPAVTQASQIFAGLSPGNYDVTTTDTTTGCVSAPTSLTVNGLPPPPLAPTASVTIQPTCTTPTGTIVVSSPIPAANVSYTVTGTNPVTAAVTQTSQIFAGLSPGNYDVTTTNTTTGCISLPTNVTVNGVPPPPLAPTASVTIQPTCTTPTGTITVSSPTPAANVTYTVIGTSPVVAAITQASPTFAGLSPGNYSVTTTDTTTGCVSPPTNLTVGQIPPPPPPPTASVTIHPTCTTPTGTIVVSSPAPGSNVSFTLIGTSPVVVAVTQASPTFAGLSPGNYSVTTTHTATGCVSPPTNLTVNGVPPPPLTPTANVTIQPTCTTPTGTIAVSAPTPAVNVAYTVIGTSPVVAAVTQASPTFAGLSPGNYAVTTTNTATGCVSPPTNLTVDQIPVPPVAPTASVTIQPTCTTPTGTIVVSAPTPAANVAYTVIGTSPIVAAVTQTSPIFAGLSPGNYSVTTTNTVTGCVSPPTSLTVNQIPPPPVAPTASVTIQPTCTTPTGTIAVSAPTPAANVAYTVIGTSPVVAAVTQTSPIFAGLSPGNYSVTTTNTVTGCVSPPTSLTVDQIPPPPAAPTASVTVQPTCTTPTGTITVSAPTPAANVTYTLIGTTPVIAPVTQTSPIFAGLLPGNYSVTTTNTTTGCVSPPTNLIVNSSPGSPLAPTASVTTQPTCTTPTGTITISAPSPGANVTYTVTGINPVTPAVTETSQIFASLSPGVYAVSTTNTTTGCVSPPVSLTVNDIPLNPVAPTASVTVQPTCTTPTGMIEVSAPVPGVNVTYTVTGTNPVVPAVTQASNIFAGLSPGNYAVTTTNTATGCVSPPTNLTVDQIPVAPVAPTASVTVQPTCTTPTGTIEVSTPVPGANVTYTVTGTNPVTPAVTQTSQIFAGLSSGVYAVTTTDTTTGCVSPPMNLTVNGVPLPPSTPTASVTIQPTCTVTTGTIEVSAPAPGANVTYTVTGTNPVTPAVTQTSQIFAGLSLGVYAVTTTDTATGCVSPPTNLTVNGVPPPPLTPTASVTIQPTCTVTTGTIEVSAPAPGANVTYTVTGTNPVTPAVTQTSQIFAGLSPGVYAVTTTDTATGCVSPPTNLTVNGVPPPPLTPTASITIQPTCTVTTGTIEVSAPTPEANVTYTVTGINPVTPAVTQTSPIFAGLSPGDYAVTTTDTTTGCISLPINLTVNGIPLNPVAPVASITIQPTCTVTTGTIEVSTPVPGANVTYTVTGTNPVTPAVTQTSQIFAGLSPGDYAVTTTDTTTGCVSPPMSLTVNDIPLSPVAPTASVTIQPSCTTPTGTIEVSAPTPGANVTYTVTGTNPVTPAVTQASQIFAGLLPGVYAVSITDTTTGCISPPVSLTVNDIPLNPIAPTASVTVQPTCTTPTGTIEVSAPTPGANVTYTVTGINPVTPAVTQTSPIFAGLSPGDYAVTTTDTTTGCVSPPMSLTVNDIPLSPVAPTASVTIQPSCTTPTGTIEVSAPTPGANVTYTVTGINPVTPVVTQTSPIFAGLSPGDYAVTTTDTTTGCVSLPMSLTVNDIPLSPVAPTASVTIQPSCTLATGTIEVSAPVSGANVTYTVTGINPVTPAVTQTSPIFAGLSSGDYAVTTTDTTTGCISPPVSLTVNDIPLNPIAPTASVTVQPTCTTPTGTIEVSAPTPGANVTYMVTGINPVTPAVTQTSPIFAGLSPGDYAVTTTDTTTGCISLPINLSVLAAPCITLIKTGILTDENGDGYAQVGETITYHFEITNTGTIPLFNITITDLLAGLVLTGGPISLEPGQSDTTTFTGVYVITQADINTNSVFNQATVSGTTSGGITVEGDGDFTVPLLEERANCTITVYNAVSPNGDGINDNLFIEGIGCYLENKVEIFNRWGVLVFEREHYNNTSSVFTGYSEGRVTIEKNYKLPSGTYFYILKYVDYTLTTVEKSGYFMLQRD